MKNMNRSGHKITKYNIEFDSLLELDIYEEFLSRDIELKRGEPIEVFNTFKTPIFCYSNDNKKFEFKREKQSIRGVTYTPDFVLRVTEKTINHKTGAERTDGYNVYIEAKGFANETFRYRWKLFKHYIDMYEPTARIFLIKRRHNGRVKEKDNTARIEETKQIVNNIIKIIYGE